MRFARYGPRGRFRSEKTYPYGADLPVITGGVTLALILMVVVVFVLPAMLHAWHELPQADRTARILYPPEARAAGVEGEVTVRYSIDSDGHTTPPEIVTGTPPGVFDQAVRDHLAGISFRPIPTVPRGGQALVTQIWRFQLRSDDMPQRIRPLRYPMMYEQIVCGRFDTPPRILSRVEPLLSADQGSDESAAGRLVVEQIPPHADLVMRGEILVTFILDESGRVTFPKITLDLRFLRPIYARTVLDAVKQWRFEPARRDGRPVPVEITQRIDLVDQLDRLYRGG